MAEKCDNKLAHMANHKELKAIAKSRLKAAKILLDHKDYDGAVYIMGYAMECCLKAIICKRLNLLQYPDKSGSRDKDNIFKTHKFDILLTLAGLESDFNINLSLERYENWSELTKWNTELRYEPIGTCNETDAERMYKALIETPNGVITWITKHRKW